MNDDEFLELVMDSDDDYVDNDVPAKKNTIDGKYLSRSRRYSCSDGMYYGSSDSSKKLPAGVYTAGFTSQIGSTLTLQDVKTDSILDLPDEASSSIIAEFEKFWSQEREFRSRGFLMKRGFLLWGPPGSGKTSTINLLSKKLIKDYDGIVIMVESSIFPYALRLVRKVEPKRKIIGIMEDLDTLVHRYGENELLATLDGESQVDNIVFMATTNYPERLDKRFIDRPSRFDTIRYIGMPSAAARRVYLQTKEPNLIGSELEYWVDVSKGFSIAHLKEMIIAVKCLGQHIDETVKRLEDMHARKPTSEDGEDKLRVGFRMAA